MSLLDEQAASPPEGDPAAVPDRARQGRGRFLRRIWRTHFYAAVIAAPVLLMFAITGLVILYTEPIQTTTQRSTLVVTPGEESIPLDQQVANALRTEPDLVVSQVVPPPAADRATLVELTDGEDLYRQVFINPYTGQVTGTRTTGDDVVGLANRLHGFLNNDAIAVTLPNAAYLIDRENGPTIEIAVSDIILEVASIWALVLALSGLYLWWPCRSQKGKPVLRIRWSKGGRLRWRDVHSASGIAFSAVLLIFIVSGMAWSNYWGASWASFAERVTPTPVFEEPTSTDVTKGDLNRFGQRIPWGQINEAVPGSDVPTDGSVARPATWDQLQQVAEEVGMRPGYSIIPPINDLEADPASFGTYQLNNPWPQRQSTARTVYVDQFTAETLAESTAGDWGAVQRVTDYTVSLHMGTQLGLLTRILTTLGCLAIVVSIVSSVVLWWKRRPKGSTGLPSRQRYRHGQLVLTGIAVVLALIYPLWGASLLVVLAIDVIVDAVRRKRSPVR